MRRVAIALLLLAAVPALAHELRPAYLELHEERVGEIRVLWKTPMRGEMRLALWPELSGPTELLTPVSTLRSGDAAVQTWRLRSLVPLRGQSLRIAGLEGTLTDGLVRIEFADGSAWVKRLTAVEPMVQVPLQPSRWSVAGEYLGLGVEHILTGIDHLLFVLVLLLITRGGWRLVEAVTAFTVAHSVTLAAATLGVVHVPQQPVEATIALSIAVVAAEIVRARDGIVGITHRTPWVAAFGFGLLHGLGFAGALGEAGLPPGHIPAALLFFNVGVEAGQLLFIGAVLAVVAGLRRARVRWPAWIEPVPAYAIGAAAMFWVVQRIAAF